MGVQAETKTKNTYEDIKNLDEEVRRSTRTAMRLKLFATSKEREAEKIKEQARVAMCTALEGMADRTGIEDAKLGKIIMAENSRSTLNQPTLKDLLVKAGVKPEVVGRCFMGATVVSVSVYPRFYPASNGG